MINTSILKTLILSVAFALCVNVAFAQKTKKADNPRIEIKADQAKAESEKEKEQEYKWVYSVATVMTDRDGYSIKFEEAENIARDPSFERTRETSRKMQEVAKTVKTETDLLNLMAQQNLEIISIVNSAQKEGMMKYYFRTKVKK